MSTARAQDISINVLSSSATLPLSTTGSIQVDLCNIDPNNVAAAVNTLNPQISVGSNVTILGVTNVDGSPLTNFTILSNTGQVIRLANSVSLPNPTCLSFKVIIQGATIDTPGTIGGIAAVLAFQGSQTPGNRTFNDNSATSVSVIAPLIGPDVTPVIYVNPSSIYGNRSMSVIVEVYELNSIATSGPITINVTRDPKLSLTFDPTANLVGGRSVQNSDWGFDDSSPDHYVLTSHQAATAGSMMAFGLSGTFSSGATSGVINVSSVIMGSEGENNLSNNADADKVEYFQQ